MEDYALVWGNYRSFTGLACGFLLSIVVMVFSFLLIRDGHDVAGTILGSVDLAALAGVFVYGSQVLRDERIKRARIMTGQEDESKADKPVTSEPGKLPDAT